MPYIVGYSVGYFAEGVVLYQYASNLFVPRKKDSHSNLYTLAAIYLLLFGAACCFRSRLFNFIGFFLATMIYLLWQYRLRAFLCLFHTALITAIMVVTEIVVYTIQQQLLPNSLAVEDTVYGMLLLGVFSKLLYFTVMMSIVGICRKHPVVNPHDRHSASLLILIPSVSIFVMLILLWIIDKYTLSDNLKNMIALSSLLLLLANLLIFCVYQYIESKNEQYTRLMLLHQREKNQAEYYEMLRVQNENQRILIHDIKKHIQSIDALNERGEREKIRAYIRQLSLSSDLQDVLVVCGYPLLNVVLGRYRQTCREKGISFHADIRAGTLDRMTDDDMTSLFCNLLDNAVEAAQGIADAYIELSCSTRNYSPYVLISVINSCSGTPYAGGGAGRMLSESDLPSTKEDRSSHGFGLKSIRKTVARYNGDLQMYYRKDTGAFHTILTLQR